MLVCRHIHHAVNVRRISRRATNGNAVFVLGFVNDDTPDGAHFLPEDEFHKGNRQEGLKLQEEFAAEFREEYKDKDHCPCQKACRYHGNCKECVAIHRAHQEHVPNCMRPILNQKIKLLSELTEHTIAKEIEPPHEVLRKEFQE